MTNKLIYSLIILLFLSVCSLGRQNTRLSKQKGLEQYNLASIYDPGYSRLNPESFVYHSNANESIVFFLQSTHELRAELSDERIEEYLYSIEYFLRDKNTYEIVDSSKITYELKKPGSPEYFYSFFTINTPDNNDYYLIINFHCILSNNKKRQLIEIDKKSIFKSQNFYVEILDPESQPVFNNFVVSDYKYRIISERIGNKPINVMFYEFDDMIASAPYAVNPRPRPITEADSVFIYKLGDTISFDKRGTYFFQASKSYNTGLVLINDGPFFPKVKTVNQMLEPIQYLSTAKEYNRIKESENLKSAIDDFWFSKSENLRTAKEQIRVFYNRVQLANIYFSDHRQGFKTDRGMIYIILGAPNIVTRTANTEEWFYGAKPERTAIHFVFKRSTNPIGDYIFELERQSEMQTFWNQAITTWRAGRIFIIN